MAEPPAYVCGACGTLNEGARRALVAVHELEDRLDVAKDDLITKGAMIKRLKSERAKSVEADPHYPDARLVLEHWQQVCAPAAREPLSETRVKPVLARLRGRYFASELMRSADGYARFPYLVKGKRSAFGDDLDRFVEAEFIYRNPQNVDRGLAMANAPEGAGTLPSAAFFARVPWEKVWRENRRLIIQALERVYGGGIDGQITPGARAWPCPFCEREDPHPLGSEPTSLTVYNQVGGKIIECYRCGLTDERLLAAITDTNGHG